MGKVVVITFGGGARDDETFSLNGQRNIPHLLEELAPQSCFFTQVVNRGILGHYVATASIATGVYETFDNFVEQSPEHPTAFEYFRRDRRRPREDAWVIAPSAGFAQMGSSQNKLYGPEKEPKWCSRSSCSRRYLGRLRLDRNAASIPWTYCVTVMKGRPRSARRVRQLQSPTTCWRD
jgi:hypothetical protein